MKDSPEFNKKLVQLVQKRPCLYNHSLNDYGDKDLQDAAWREISKKVNESVTDCKERWKNLRGCYTRHLRKSNKPTGSYARLVKPYYLANHLQFLDSFTKQKPMRGFLKVEKIDLVDWEATNGIEIDSDPEDSHELETPIPNATPSPTDEVETYYQDDNQSSTPNQINQTSKNVSLSNVNSTLTESLQTRPNIIQYNEHQDPDLAFLYSLLPDFRDMNREQKRRFKVGILKLADNILLENIPALESNTTSNPPHATFSSSVVHTKPGSCQH